MTYTTSTIEMQHRKINNRFLKLILGRAVLEIDDDRPSRDFICHPVFILCGIY